MKFAEPRQTTTKKLLSGSVALFALILSSCTSTSNGTASLQMTSTAEGSIIAETLQSAADQTIAEEASAGTEKAALSAKPGQADNKLTTTAATPEKPAAAQEAPVQVAALAPQTKSTSLFGIFGKKSTDSPTTSAPEAAPETVPETTKKTETEKPAEQQKQTALAKPSEPEKEPQATSLFGSAKNANAYATPQRPANAGQGSIARLFNENNADGAAKTENKKLAVLRPAAKSKHEYNYSLPGVRPNGGFEIKHRKSIYDDSDIDANEYDDYASVQLASAPGLARLAPNGLKVQRETVDVACLKPQLVSMLKTMERHFRKPVMVTSGYRSPSYNRKVNGARKSLHMICAAADIQIAGVSKHEIARYARKMSNRGGVGTYCHTTSVHVDIGPERDWNWSCKR
ncbi:D-Ala-D-Ala carboxypeptidase family metallohydrolase [Brucella gallinifaecis]|uniref:Murein endopeptidase K n=1 Tax=Brucella gallinifaecis TaxID=215590 RepID=A0A502BPA5_9HYPH|nr:YcbK family protein [Brucella gallinifaecis]TPF75637.1 DUF882 domain-containing protein [Brucella gallinifaecis]